MKRAIGVIAAGALTASLGTGLATPAEAGKKVFRKAETCAWYMPPDWEAGLSLNLEVSAGHFYAEDGSSLPCYDQFYDEFRPTVKRFKVTVRWYAGSTRIKTQRAKVPNTRSRHRKSFRLASSRLAQDGTTWTYAGKRVTARVVFTKPGYRTKRVRVTRFAYPAE
ncbi:hypothetical protein NODU109028_15555 [Nocardioides dubius]|uniref:Uncharacterized protein n=1 Tax=Nocardioides dubius TaxID=317019 RepID=A0ABP4EKQ8_9ACTN